MLVALLEALAVRVVVGLARVAVLAMAGGAAGRAAAGGATRRAARCPAGRPAARGAARAAAGRPAEWPVPVPVGSDARRHAAGGEHQHVDAARDLQPAHRRGEDDRLGPDEAPQAAEVVRELDAYADDGQPGRPELDRTRRR